MIFNKTIHLLVIIFAILITVALFPFAILCNFFNFLFINFYKAIKNTLKETHQYIKHDTLLTIDFIRYNAIFLKYDEIKAKKVVFYRSFKSLKKERSIDMSFKTFLKTLPSQKSHWNRIKKS